MKKTFLVLTVTTVTSIFILTGCGVQSSSNVDVKPENISYFQDSRTDKCFAVMASRKSFRASSTGLGMAEVDCDEKVMKLISKNT